MNDWTAGKTFPGKKTKILPNVDEIKNKPNMILFHTKRAARKK